MGLPDLEQIKYGTEYLIKDAGDALKEAITHEEFKGELRHLGRIGLQDRKTVCIKDAAVAGQTVTKGIEIYFVGKGMEFIAKRMTGRWGIVMYIGSKVLKAAGFADMALGTWDMAEVYRKSQLIDVEASKRYVKEKE